MHALGAAIVTGLFLTTLNFRQLMGPEIQNLLKLITRDDPLNDSSHPLGIPINSDLQDSTTRQDFQNQNKRLDGDGDTLENAERRENKVEPLNIVLLYGDDWRHDSIGAANTSIVKTPFLDWLATQGMRFTHNCVTTSVCWISRATLYTGQYYSRHKSDYPHKPHWYGGWKDAWPQILRDKGYYLGHVGKWHFNWTKLVYRTFHYAKAYHGKWLT